MKDILICGYNEKDLDNILSILYRKAEKRGIRLKSSVEWNHNSRNDNLCCHVRPEGSSSGTYILKGHADMIIANGSLECARHIDMLKYKGRVIITGDDSDWLESNRVRLDEVRDYIKSTGCRIYKKGHPEDRVP